MISFGYIEEPRFFEPYNPLRDNYVPKFYNSSDIFNKDFSNDSESRIIVFVRIV